MRRPAVPGDTGSMVMFAVRPGESQVIETLVKDTDRSVAIVGGSLVESRLDAEVGGASTTERELVAAVVEMLAAVAGRMEIVMRF